MKLSDEKGRPMSKVVGNIQRLLKRMDRALSGPIVEFSEQFLYGHREILVSYAGLPDNSLIKGSLEHGWAIQSGRGIRKISGRRYIYLSWSQSRIDWSGVTDHTTIPIGAPFVYAWEKVRNQVELHNPENSRKILFFPVHGNEYFQQNVESQIALFKGRFDPTNSTVCLYWAEFINPEIYRAYKSHGFGIVCLGFSGQMEHTGLGYSARRLAGSQMGGRPNFIPRFIALVANYEQIVFGGIGTALIYSSYMNKKVSLLHEYLEENYGDFSFDQLHKFSENEDEMLHVNYICSFMGEDFSRIDFNSPKFREFAKNALGEKEKKTSEELSNLLKDNISFEANPQSTLEYKGTLLNFASVLDSFRN